MEFQPLSEATPQFRDFHIQNVVVKGAEKGIFVRGLPEMNVKNITIEEGVFQAKRGFVCQEGENITLKNITLIPEENNIIQIQDSKNITLDNIQYKENTNILLQVYGERSKNIRLLNTDTSKAKKDIELGKNVKKEVVKAP